MKNGKDNLIPLEENRKCRHKCWKKKDVQRRADTHRLLSLLIDLHIYLYDLSLLYHKHLINYTFSYNLDQPCLIYI